MALSVNVSGDLKKLTRHLNATQKRVLPSVTIQSVNQVARDARKDSIKKVATDLRLPQKNIRKRFNARGEVKGDRVQYFKASRYNKSALLRVYHRGISVSQIAGAQTKRGLKAKGGRLYVGAFKLKSGRLQGLVFKRRGKKRLPVFLPRISVRAQLEDQFNRRMTGALARRNFLNIFQTKLRKRLAKLRV